MIPDYWKTATQELTGHDEILGSLIAAYPGLTLRSRGDAFATLARSIVGQQISVKAAESVWQKLLGVMPAPSPLAVLDAAPASLRACGLSGRKVEYLQDLAQHFANGALDIAAWQEADDEQLIAGLCRVKGIGRWTAEMFMIFYLLRPDVFPVDDIGLQRAMNRLYNRDQPLSKKKMREIAAIWSPWRSVATWYLWRSLDPVPVEY